jgi:hypothetical protein
MPLKWEVDAPLRLGRVRVNDNPLRIITSNT